MARQKEKLDRHPNSDSEQPFGWRMLVVSFVFRRKIASIAAAFWSSESRDCVVAQDAGMKSACLETGSSVPRRNLPTDKP